MYAVSRILLRGIWRGTVMVKKRVDDVKEKQKQSVVGRTIEKRA